MVFLSKEESLKLAAELGIDTEGLSWPELQKAISEGQKKSSGPKAGEEVVVTKPAKTKTVEPKPSISDYKGKTILISPEIRATRYQRFKYDEELDDDLEIEEAMYDGTTLDQRNTDNASGTYIVRGKTGKKVVAQSTLPKINAAITFRPDHDMFRVLTYEGKSGYQYTHVKQVLRQSGYWEDYKRYFQDEPNIWYAAGKQLCCDIGVVHHVMKEIEKRERQKREHGSDYL